MSGSAGLFEALRKTERRAALATLIATEGASPRRAGARMCVGDGGRILGSVTIGGCVDARVIEEAAAVLAEGTSHRVAMSLGDEDAWALGMTCAGTVEVLVDPVDFSRTDDPVVRAQDEVARALRDGRTVIEVATLDGPARRLVLLDDGSASGTLGDAALDSAAARHAAAVREEGRSMVCDVPVAGATRALFFDLQRPPATLVIVGATHVAMPLVELARIVGYHTVVIDGRERFATRERFPAAHELRVGMPTDEVARVPLTRTTAVVLVAHDYKYDLPVLQAVLASEAGYVGLLGSVRRGKAILEFLADAGVPAAQLARVHVPIGLDIGARTPEEIALAVLAEAVAVREGRRGGALRERKREEAAMRAAERPSE